MIFLQIVFFAQLLVMLSGFTILVATPVGFQTLGLMFYLVIIAAAVLVFALWQFARHPVRRRWAMATAATPVFCLASPFLLIWLNGGPIHPVILVALVIVAAIVAFFVLLARTAQWNTGGVFANKRFNIGLLLTLSVLFVLYWIPIIGWLYNQDSWKMPSDIKESDAIVRNIAIYYVSVAGPALLMSFFTLLFAPIGLVRNAGGRIVHGGQLAVALVSLASLALGASVLGIMMINPG